jgi:hypothetical protein
MVRRRRDPTLVVAQHAQQERRRRLAEHIFLANEVAATRFLKFWEPTEINLDK